MNVLEASDGLNHVAVPLLLPWLLQLLDPKRQVSYDCRYQWVGGYSVIVKRSCDISSE